MIYLTTHSTHFIHGYMASVMHVLMYRYACSRVYMCRNVCVHDVWIDGCTERWNDEIMKEWMRYRWIHARIKRWTEVWVNVWMEVWMD